MLEVLLGQIPEAIYFSLFMIFAKGLKEKRILFTILMIIEYLLLSIFLAYNIWFQISYTFITFILLKVLYKEKSQITDIFTFTISSIILTIFSIFSFIIIKFTIGKTIYANILCKVLMFMFIILINNKLYKITELYRKIWNRESNKTKIKTTTFRSINIVIFNIIFYILNICMLYTTVLKGGV